LIFPIVSTHNTPAAPVQKRDCCTTGVVSFGRCSTPSAGHFCTLFYIPIAFVGDLSLLELADKRGGLWRRAGEGRRLVLRGIERGDVEGLAADFGLSDAASVEALYQVARREGGLGYVATISRHACKLAGRDRVEGAHVLAAIEYLNLNRLGAK
ncbi:MAG: hypothetical protein Q8O82_14650, partial [Pseudorhodobacter sp.]|nr:hypothetical protein [Pseudorhodobacter sp.]